MIRLPSFLSRLRRNQNGSVIIEFALLGPTMILLVLGVLQVGLGMQNYNALRSVSADVQRYAAISYQNGTRPDADALETYTTNTAIAAPYALKSGGLLTVTVTPVATSRVVGATEYTLAINYVVPTILTIIGIENIPISYSRPIFVAI